MHCILNVKPWKTLKNPKKNSTHQEMTSIHTHIAATVLMMPMCMFLHPKLHDRER